MTRTVSPTPPVSSPPAAPASPSVDAADASSGWASLRQRALGSAAWTIGGYGAAQAIRLAANLVLTRLLFPEAFGLMAIVNIVMQGLQMFSDVGIAPSIIQNRRGDEPAFFNTAWTVQIVRGVALWGISFAIAWPIAWFYGQAELRWLIPAAGFTALLAGFNSTALATLNRKVMLARLTVMELVAQILSIGAMIGAAVVTGSVWSLVLGGVVGAAVKLAWSHRVDATVSNRLHWDRAAASSLFSFGRWIFVSTLLTFLAIQLDRLLLGKLFDIERLGVYTVALTFAQLAPLVMRKLVSAVVFPVLASTVRDEPELLRQRLFSIRLAVLGPGAALLAALHLSGEPLIALLYDARYHDAGWMLETLAAGAMAALVNVSASQVLLARGESSRIALMLAPQVVLLVVGSLVGHHFGGERGFVAAVASVELLTYPVLAVMLRRRGLWQPAADLPILMLVVIGVLRGIEGGV